MPKLFVHPITPLYTLKIITIVLLLIVANVSFIDIVSWRSGIGQSDEDVSSFLEPSDTTLGVFGTAAVVSSGLPCAGIGRDMLEKEGSAVDAAIATLLCESVCIMGAMGPGGGCSMTIYDKPSGKMYSLDARESAPAAATQDMFVDNHDKVSFGAMSAAIPGELKAYQEAHNKFGKLPWKDLFEPTIKLCLEGVPVSKVLEGLFIHEEALIQASPTFINSILESTNGQLPVEGDYLKLPQLAKTYTVIAESPNMADELYKGELTEMFVNDIQEGGGIISVEDMNNYEVKWKEPYTAGLAGGLTAYSSALPGSGILMTFILRVLDGLLPDAENDLQRTQMIIETFKHAYGHRSKLGDPDFIDASLLEKTISELTGEESILRIRSLISTTSTSNDYSFYGAEYHGEDHGTNNIAVVAPDGSAVCVTSTINYMFGSKFVSTSTGILLNNEMDDFSTPGLVNDYKIRPSEANFIQPGKRPMSSTCPTIVVNSEGDVQLVVGGVGGSHITTQVALVAIRNLWLGKNIKEAIDMARFHHQLVPMEVDYEYGILEELVEGWKAIGHSTKQVDYLGIISGIARSGSDINVNCDWRQPGSVAGF